MCPLPPFAEPSPSCRLELLNQASWLQEGFSSSMLNTSLEQLAAVPWKNHGSRASSRPTSSRLQPYQDLFALAVQDELLPGPSSGYVLIRALVILQGRQRGADAVQHSVGAVVVRGTAGPPQPLRGPPNAAEGA